MTGPHIPGLRTALAAVSLLLIGGAARAQGTSADTKMFVYGLRSESAYEANPLFIPNGPEDLSTRVTGTGSLQMGTGHGTLSLIGNVDRSFYRQLTQLSAFNYSGTGAASYAVSPRFGVQGAASYVTQIVSNRAFTDPTQPVTPLGADGVTSVPVPSTMFHSLTAGGGGAYAISERTGITANGLYQQVLFDSSGVPDGKSMTVGGALTHQYSERTAVGFSYQMQKNFDVAQTEALHTVALNWGRSFTMAQVRLHGGAILSAAPNQNTWSGGGQFTFLIPRGALDLQYERRAQQAFGLGTVLFNDNVTLSASRYLGRFTGQAFGAVGRGRNKALSTFKLDTYTGGLTLGYPMATSVRLLTSLYYRAQSETFWTSDRGVRVLLSYDGHYF